MDRPLCTQLHDCIHVHRYTIPFQNEISEEEQRWGSKTVEGSTGRAGALRYETKANYHLGLYGKVVHSLWSYMLDVPCKCMWV